MHLSGIYGHRERQYELDLMCIAYQINPRYNEDIQEHCRELYGGME